MHHIGLRLDDERGACAFAEIGVELGEGVKMPGGGTVTSIDISEDHPQWKRLKLVLTKHAVVDIVWPEFSSTELDSARFLRIAAKVQKGYPQPTDKKGYLAASFDLTNYCQYCGMGKNQNHPFRVQGLPKIKDNSLLQLNWVFDELFVSRATWEQGFKPFGVDARPVLAHRAEEVIDSIVQLDIPQHVELAIKNHEYRQCRHCGRKKYMPIFRDFLPAPIDLCAPIARSNQSFGDGALAYNLLIVSNTLYRSLRDIEFQGAKFLACRS